MPQLQRPRHQLNFDPELIVPNPNLSLREGAICPGRSALGLPLCRCLTPCEHYHFDVYTPYKNLPEKVQKMLLYGYGEESIKFSGDDHRHCYKRPFEGMIQSLKGGMRNRVLHDPGRNRKVLELPACPSCEGARLKPVPWR